MKRRCLALLIVALALQSQAENRVVEIARGESWVSPYWGYSTPKIVCDGNAYYTAGLWGDTPETSHGVVYKLTGSAWQAGAKLPNIYQPATLLLDSGGKLIVLYNMENKPVVVLRSNAPGDINSFETLPAPPDMVNGYYLGAAIQNDVVFLAYASIPSYSMYLSRLDLKSGSWSPAILLSQGQVETKPKTAWTYPILYPDAQGLHFVASSCPDGGDGNTYNKVWYLFIPHGNDKPSIEELVAESPLGYNAYATDLIVDIDGNPHVVHMWNAPKYGEPLPESAAKTGMYISRRNKNSGAWTPHYLSPICIAGFWRHDDALSVINQEDGGLVSRTWQRENTTWSPPSTLLSKEDCLTPPSFMDVLSAASGSTLAGGIALVTDGVVESPSRIVWSLLPD